MLRLAARALRARATLNPDGGNGCALATLPRAALRKADVDALANRVRAASVAHSVRSVLLAPSNAQYGAARGSSVRSLAEASGAARVQYFHALAGLIDALGECGVPTVAALGGEVCGSGVGVAAHADFFVASDATRLALPGVAHGYLPESLALHRASGSRRQGMARLVADALLLCRRAVRRGGQS